MNRYPLIALALLACLPARGNAADTTYSRTRTAGRGDDARGPDGPQACGRGGGGDGGWRIQVDAEPGEGGSLFSRCVGFAYSGDFPPSALLALPAVAGVCGVAEGLYRGPAFLAVGASEAPVRKLVGLQADFHLGGAVLSGVAGGPVAGFGLGLLLDRERAFKQRIEIGMDLGAGVTAVDFERDVYADGARLGVQRDMHGAYFACAVPALWQCLWSPGGGDGAFHLYAGAGGELYFDHLAALRAEDWKPGPPEDLNLSGAPRFFPALCLGLGRFALAGRHGLGVDLRYLAAFPRATRLTSLPSDNTAMIHQVRMAWSVLL